MTTVDRRSFLWTTVVAVTAALTGQWWATRRPPSTRAMTAVPIAGGGHLEPGAALDFAIPEHDIRGVLVRAEDGRYRAFDRRCPHLGCPVLWSKNAQRFECPCHAASFAGDNGRVLAGPPRRGLRQIEVEIVEGEVWAQRLGAAAS